jgi:predicted phage terminase large subunit-like protein
VPTTYKPTPEDFAHTRLIAYCAYQWPGYRDARHHRLIARKLEAVERGEIKRLMIFMPPRHGKSMLASEFFPAWYLGRNPEHYVIASTYSQDLADDFGRKVKAQIADPTFQAIFPHVKLADDSQSVKRFHVETGGMEVGTAQRGAYYAVGVGGPLTGRGAHLLLIDDPTKNREDADSELGRRRLKDWYTSTAYTRLMPGARIVVIQTRWHESDLSGWLLEEHGHEGWDVLSLPALSNGAALWPEQYPAGTLETIKASIGPRDWAALYQQEPSSEEGTFFKREWFKHWKTKPSELHIYGTSDYAVTADGGDWSVHRIWGVDPKGDLYRLDGWRGQTASDQWIEEQINLIERYRPMAWFGEAGVIAKAIEPMLTRRMRERRQFCRMEWLPSISDKPTRARGIQSRLAMGAVWFELGADVEEYIRFPTGRNDDDVDTGSLMGRALDMAHPAVVAPKEVAKRVDRWAIAFGEHQDKENWKTT